MNRVHLGKMQNPVRGFLHGAAALASIAGLVALVVRANGAANTAASAIYGATLIAMYLTSALYHSVPWHPTWKTRLQSLDHTFIYALVAATFTPLVIGTGEAVWVVLGLAGVWTLVALGFLREIVHGRARRILLPLQFLAVSVTLAPLLSTLLTIDTAAAAMTIVGGAVYLVGVCLFVNDRPRLSPGIFSHHEFFHVIVIIASLIHFIAIWRVVAIL
ncbi:MAG TPA: hemolysin III family protein [Acidimicrobiia bacterium]|nr:hemolysin III family protein [Acidimicrobiia bacterium]